MQITVTRRWNAPSNSEFRATVTGTLSIDGQPACFTLENEALMIPAGTYPTRMQWSERFQRKTPHLFDVPERTLIEIHGGNVAIDSEGCVLVAEHRLDDYHIFESKPATDLIEESLNMAEANSETNTITIL